MPRGNRCFFPTPHHSWTSYDFKDVLKDTGPSVRLVVFRVRRFGI